MVVVVNTVIAIRIMFDRNGIGRTFLNDLLVGAGISLLAAMVFSGSDGALIFGEEVGRLGAVAVMIIDEEGCPQLTSTGSIF
ncbi:MAG: hypothetical protein ACR2OU_18290 [Thermomicrobiales bacterium]